MPDPVRGGFTTRDGGVSAAPWNELNLALHVEDEPRRVLANRDLLAHEVGRSQVIFPRQAHGAAVTVIGPDQSRCDTDEADALVTREPDVAIGILVADCLPVLLADPHRRVIGAAHAGRAGLAAGVLPATVAAMIELGADVADLVAVVGPAVCGRCYEVSAQIRADVDAQVPLSASVTRANRPSLDLAAGAARQLSNVGVSEVRRTWICTVEDNRFFSYRRDGLTGRFAGVVMLEHVTDRRAHE